MLRRIYAAITLLSVALATLLFARDAAAGTWKLKDAQINEVSGGWHLYMSIELSSAPSIAHVPMKFMFTKTMVYERALVDGSKDPVINRVPLQNQMPQMVTQDIDFSDASGKTFKGTRFDFSITRTAGFESGEYTVKLRTADGVDIGGAQTLILKGDNPVVDRRSITFSAKGGKDVKKVDDGTDAGAKVAQNDVESAVPTNGDVTPAGSAAPFIPSDAYQKTDEEQGIKDHPKGCGCDVPGVSTGSLAWALAPALGVVIVLRRRRRAA